MLRTTATSLFTRNAGNHLLRRAAFASPLMRTTSLPLPTTTAAAAVAVVANNFTALAAHSSGGSGSINSCPEKKKCVRNPHFKATVDAADIAAFRKFFGDDADNKGVITSPEGIEAYRYDWFKDYSGEPPVVLRPTTTQQVSDILSYCNSKKIAVAVQGGNTGFVGGATPVFNEVLINMGRMNKVIELDDVAGTLRCEAGCILGVLDDYVQTKGFLMPVDLGASGSCHIGGNVSTNAGGLRYFRYGSLQGNVLGLTVVLPTGEVLDLMSALQKDNTGFHLKNLFVGHEGLLGIITEVGLKLAPKPQSVQTAFLATEGWEELISLLKAARRDLGEILSATEMIDGAALDTVLDITKLDSPLPDRAKYYLLVETNGSNAEHDQAKLFAFLEKCSAEGIVSHGTIAENDKQTKHIWSMRELCATAPTRIGHTRWYDISMPVTRFAEIINGCRKALADAKIGEDRAKIIGFGHASDGNLHLNVISISDNNTMDKEAADVVDSYIYGVARESKFSVSAEHGIGMQKKKYLPYTKPANAIEHMRALKKHFDLNGILTPYKVFN